MEYPKEWEKRVTLKNRQQVVLRPELSTDTEMLWEMFSTLSEASLNNLVLPFTRERIESWTGNIDYDKNLPILALIEEEGKQRIIGSASLSFNSAEALKHKAEFGITVHDDYQNMGLGTAMVKHLLGIARKKGLKKMFLLVNTDNKRAISLYEKCGFEIEAILKKEYYRRGKFRDHHRMAIFI
ncbi:MAG: GNAT family N-acetyltransferase [Candidatus Bathyarchaeota archaeon]|nr:GNAT family N-acetyltransferase [Candidatus Bathyarchaeota archaeon]